MAKKNFRNEQDFTEIKRAVSDQENSDQIIPPERTQPMDEQTTAGAPVTNPSVQEYPGEMQPSILSNEDQSQQDNFPTSPQVQDNYEPYSQQNSSYQQPQYQQSYDSYQPYPGTLSSDTITEIVEQVFSEKLSQINNKLEKNLDLKSTIIPKMESIDERLKRIETIIDQLQLSVLQKVGEYTSSVSDLKSELLETQKSFKALSKSKNSKKNQIP